VVQLPFVGGRTLIEVAATAPVSFALPSAVTHFPTGSALAVAGTTGGALGLFLEGVLYNFTGSHARAVCYLTVFWIVSPLIMWFLPETSGRELEEISPETNAT